METIKWSDFEKIEMRVGTIREAEFFEEAIKPAFKLLIDFGPTIGLKKSSAQLTRIYTPDELIGKQIVAVINFPPKQIGPMSSECLVLGAVDPTGAVVVLQTERKISDGLRIA